jgi:hypothetical protein
MDSLLPGLSGLEHPNPCADERLHTIETSNLRMSILGIFNHILSVRFVL